MDVRAIVLFWCTWLLAPTGVDAHGGLDQSSVDVRVLELVQAAKQRRLSSEEARELSSNEVGEVALLQLHLAKKIKTGSCQGCTLEPRTCAGRALDYVLNLEHPGAFIKDIPLRFYREFGYAGFLAVAPFGGEEFLVTQGKRLASVEGGRRSKVYRGTAGRYLMLRGMRARDVASTVQAWLTHPLATIQVRVALIRTLGPQGTNELLKIAHSGRRAEDVLVAQRLLSGTNDKRLLSLEHSEGARPVYSDLLRQAKQRYAAGRIDVSGWWEGLVVKTTGLCN